MSSTLSCLVLPLLTADLPRLVEFARDLPREDSGKIFERCLRDPNWKKPDAGFEAKGQRGIKTRRHLHLGSTW